MKRLNTLALKTRPLFLWGSVVFGFVVGLALTVFREKVIPEHYMFDARKIQDIAMGTWNLPSDPAFDNTAAVYRALGVADAVDVVSFTSYVLASLVIVFAIYRSGARAANIFHGGLIVAAFVLAGIYLADYSKDSFILIIAVALLAMPRGVIGDFVLFLMLAGYAIFFREYWVITAVVYLGLRLVTGSRRLAPYTMIIAAGVAVAIGLAFFVAMGLAPDHFRTYVNTSRTVEAATEIPPFLNFGEPLSGALNVFLSYIALVIPFPLLFTASIGHVPLLAAIAFLWVTVIVGVLRHSGWRSEPGRFITIKRAIALLFAFLAVQALFEPDYGSALRHLTPLLSLAIFACLALPRADEQLRIERVRDAKLQTNPAPQTSEAAYAVATD